MKKVFEYSARLGIADDDHVIRENFRISIIVLGIAGLCEFSGRSIWIAVQTYDEPDRDFHIGHELFNEFMGIGPVG